MHPHSLGRCCAVANPAGATLHGPWTTADFGISFVAERAPSHLGASDGQPRCAVVAPARSSPDVGVVGRVRRARLAAEMCGAACKIGPAFVACIGYPRPETRMRRT